MIASPEELLSHKSLFVEKGYLIVRNAIDIDCIKEMHNSTIKSLLKLSTRDIDNAILEISENDITAMFHQAILSLVSEKKLTPYEIQKYLWKDFLYNDLPEKVLNSTKVIQYLKELIGSDLQYSQGTALTISLPKGTYSANNYLFKKYHQEVWSGSSIDNIQFWTPILQSSIDGQLTVIDESHKWGLIPNRNREPIDLPPYSESKTDLKEGDIILFHPLLLHRSSSLPSNCLTRIGWPMMIRNWRAIKHSNFDERWNWKTFHSSAHSQVELALGNSYLSPYRIKDIANP